MKQFLLLSLTFLLFVTSVDAAQWIQKGESAFAEGEISNTEIYGVGAPASIHLKTIGFQEWGNDFMVTEQTEFRLDDPSYRYSYRFTAQTDKIVTKVWLCILRTFSVPEYIVGIQENIPAPPAPNHPSGVWLSSATFSPPDPGPFGWHEITLSTYPLIAGTTYHLVVEYTGSELINSSNYIGIYGTKPQNNKVPFDNSLDPMSEQLDYDGADWNVRNAQPLFVIVSDTDTYEGNSYYKIEEDLKIYKDFWRGEKFSISGGDKTVKKVFFYLRSNTVSPADDLYVVLENVTDNIEMVAEAIDKSKIKTYYNEYEHTFTTPYVLEDGKEYRLYLKSPSSTDENYYLIKRLCVDYYPADETNLALISTTYKGEDAIYTSWDGDNWTDESFADFIFKFQSVTYYLNGEFISSTFDTGSPSEFEEISWEPISQPSPSTLKFQIATSESPNGPWLFFGPDGTVSTYYTQGNGEEISSRHSGKRHIKYKAFFTSSDSSYSPQLNKITIEYDARPLFGTALEIRNDPNPFQAGIELTSIKYILEKDSSVTIEIYTLLGDLVKKIKKSPGEEGGRGEENGYENSVDWDGRNGKGMLVANGVYLCRIIAEPQDGSKSIEEIRKIAVIK